MSEGYEVRDAKIKPLLWTAFWLTVLCIFSFVICFALLRYFENTHNEKEKLDTRSYSFSTIQEPRLQTDEINDYKKFKEEEDYILNHYGWVSKQNNKVHIPIHKAIRRLVDGESL